MLKIAYYMLLIISIIIIISITAICLLSKRTRTFMLGAC